MLLGVESIVAFNLNFSCSWQVMVWDTSTSSSVRSSCCVGKSTVPGAPKALKCHESLIYVAAGSSVVAIDIRTMRQVFKVNHQEELHSFQMLPEKSLICTGLAQRYDLSDSMLGFLPLIGLTLFDKLLHHYASAGLCIVVFVLGLYLLGLCYTAVELEDN